MAANESDFSRQLSREIGNARDTLAWISTDSFERKRYPPPVPAKNVSLKDSFVTSDPFYQPVYSLTPPASGSSQSDPSNPDSGSSSSHHSPVAMENNASSPYSIPPPVPDSIPPAVPDAPMPPPPPIDWLERQNREMQWQPQRQPYLSSYLGAPTPYVAPGRGTTPKSSLAKSEPVRYKPLAEVLQASINNPQLKSSNQSSYANDLAPPPPQSSIRRASEEISHPQVWEKEGILAPNMTARPSFAAERMELPTPSPASTPATFRTDQERRALGLVKQGSVLSQSSGGSTPGTRAKSPLRLGNIGGARTYVSYNKSPFLLRSPHTDSDRPQETDILPGSLPVLEKGGNSGYTRRYRELAEALESVDLPAAQRWHPEKTYRSGSPMLPLDHFVELLSNYSQTLLKLCRATPNLGEEGEQFKQDVWCVTSALQEILENNCAKCGQAIGQSRPGCAALDKTFHIECFTCAVCDKRLAGGSFYSVGGKPYCENDYRETLEKCENCKKPIMDRILRASGKPFHPGCFTCTACSKSLDGVPFTVDSNNAIHCVDCFHEKYAPRCARCSKPIVPEDGKEESLRVVAMDKSYHVDCYRCEDCNKSLNSKIDGHGCYPLEDHILCKECNLARVTAKQ